MKKIRVAHFGIAHDHSTATIICARKYPEIFDVVAICEPDEPTRALFGGNSAYAGVPWISEEALFARDDLDAVFCEGHELRSVSDARKCIDRGLHVHLDKPGGTDLAAFEKLLHDADAMGLTLQMAYMYRYNPAFRHLLKSVREGRLGVITGIDGSFGVCHDQAKRRWLKQFPGGMMFFLGCHVLDMILLLNGVPSSVHGYNHSSDWNNEGSQDSAFAVLDYPHGACTIRANATENNGAANRRLLVMGTKGTIEIRPLESPTLIRETMYDDSADYRWCDGSRGLNPGYMAGRYDDMMLEFAACVRGEIRNPYSSAHEIAVQSVLLEACQ